ncbi:heavy-metal-associated domain-containing protein [Planococcus sp. FY231025]|uniref:heavy-metal-associated domain-containing protein n=1 Tax=Planococcus sp. FY231025 TaxID=3455699 RepID=UPI003F8E8439
METITIFVKEAISEKPIQELEAVVSTIEGVERALVDTGDGEVKITFDTKRLSKEEIFKKIREDGFHIVDDSGQ